MADGSQSPEITSDSASVATRQDAFVAGIQQRAAHARERGLPMPIAGGAEPPGPRLYLADASGNITGAIDVGRRAAVAASIPPGGVPPRPPEAPPSMPSPEQPEIPREEYEFSAEKGRKIAEDIINFRTKMSYQERYTGENGLRLKQLYKDLQEYVNRVCQRRHEVDPWDPRRNFPIPSSMTPEQLIALPPDQRPANPPELSLREVIAQALDRRINPVNNGEVQAVQEDLSNVRSLKVLFELYENPATPNSELASIEQELGKYFSVARSKGLLKGVDDLLLSIYKDEIQGGASDAQTREMITRKMALARRAAETAFKSKRSDPEINKLYGVWEPYLSWAEERFEAALTGQDQLPNRVGEWSFTEKSEDTEIYWEPSPNYPGYYHVIARSPAQFRRAKETFLEVIKNGALGQSPDELMKHLINFKDALSARGNSIAIEQATQPDGLNKMTPEFMEELRQEFEAEAFVWGADYNNETYNAKGYKDYMMAMTLHEGPARWTRLIRAGEGKVAVFTDMFDRDQLMEIFFNPGGERGEIDIIAMHYLQDQVRQIVIEKGMGVQLKDYNPRDTNISSSPQAKLARFFQFNGVDAVSLKANLERIGIHDQDLESLFEGFNDGRAHINNFEKFKDLEENSLPPILRESVALGRIQLEVDRIRQEIREGRENRSHNPLALLNPRDRKRYEDALAKAEVNFEIAFQMQGVSGEKVRKGKGFFYVDRNPYVQAFRKFEDVDDSQLNPQQKKDKQIGRILVEIKDGRRVDNLTSDERSLYEALTPEQRENYVDHVPVYMAESFVQVAVTAAKIKYANSSAQFRQDRVKEARDRAILQIKNRGFEAELLDVDYDEHGRQIGQLRPLEFKTPKLRMNTDGSIYRDSNGKVEVLDVENKRVTVRNADAHIYSRYTTHTYWGYQGENRHMLLAPHIFEAARRIRDGLSRPEDEDMLATQLLITDPTLNRIRKFDEDQMQREITLLMAAVEESFQGRQDLRRELFKAFLPEDGYRGKMKAGYAMEDWGGMMRFTMGLRELVASQPARFSRRLGSEIAIIPMEIDSMSAIWAQRGVMGAVNTFADQIKRYTHQGVVGQFGITKFIDSMDYGVQLYKALIGDVDGQSGQHVEGLYMKPTNNNEKLHRFYGKEAEIAEYPQHQIPFLYEFKETFGRLEKVLKIMRVMYSDVRNAGGALSLENVDIFLENGRFNPQIESDRKISGDTGTSRHSQKVFYDAFINWLLSDKPGGGGQAYPDERYWNQFLNVKRVYSLGEGILVSNNTIKDWLFDKIAL